MKIEKITENKIRIVLNIDDLAKKNIDIQSLIKNTDITQDFFRNLLKQAQKEVGFEADDSKLLIEAFMTSEGFFVLTFTKIAESTKNDNSSFLRPKVKRKNLNTSCKDAIYMFESFEDFENFSTYLNNSKIKNLNGIAKKISFYKYNFQYFLVLSQIDTNYKYLDLFYALISEFAKLSSNSLCFESKLLEFGDVIFKNKSDLMNGIKLFNKA